ncbi:MAG: hypothetical protein WAT79_08660 [Saprospiraceae bacterium]
MYLKVDIKFEDEQFPPFFTNQKILDNINSRLRAELVDMIRDLQVLEHPDPHKLTEVQTEVVIIVDPKSFFDKLKELHDQRLSVKFFMDRVIEYVSCGNV